MKSTKTIYLSTCEISDLKMRTMSYLENAVGFMEEVKYQFNVSWYPDMWDYPKIDECINLCDWYLAVIDDIWLSSSGRMMELAYVRGEGQSLTGKAKLTKPKKSFIYCPEKYLREKILLYYPGTIILDVEAKSAIQHLINESDKENLLFQPQSIEEELEKDCEILQAAMNRALSEGATKWDAKSILGVLNHRLTFFKKDDPMHPILLAAYKKWQDRGYIKLVNGRDHIFVVLKQIRFK